jgi:serine/threonine protein phosphatase PrpC
MARGGAGREEGSLQAPFALDVASSTHPGKVRPVNEDALLVEPLDGADVAKRGLLLVVADGMGGHEAGEVASKLATEAVRDAYYDGSAEELAARLNEAVSTANARVFEAAQETGKQGMGTTLTAAVIQGNKLILGQVGDSRAYLIRGNQVHQLTTDHSWVQQQVEAGVLTREQARTHPNRNVITRAIGQEPQVEIDIFSEPSQLLVDDWLLLCSDGLHSLVGDDELPGLLAKGTAQQAADKLVKLAVSRGAPDNVTVVLVHVNSGGPKLRLNREGALGRRILANFPGLGLLAALVLAIGVLALFVLAFGALPSANAPPPVASAVSSPPQVPAPPPTGAVASAGAAAPGPASATPRPAAAASPAPLQPAGSSPTPTQIRRIPMPSLGLPARRPPAEGMQRVAADELPLPAADATRAPGSGLLPDDLGPILGMTPAP